MDKFDVIIVGAGLAGLGAAYTLAEQGLEVLVLERGDYPGAKNVTGGRLYVNPIRDFFPGIWEQAPLERFITHEGITLMAENRSVTLNYSGNELRKEPHQSYSILRAQFDRWLSELIEAKGVMVLSKTRVDDVLRENGHVVGVVAGEDELRADVVIACDGVLSLIAEKAGLRKPGSPHDFAVGIKEIIALNPNVINDRFCLEGNEGAARLFVGEVTKGKFGGGFLYTNRESVSLGVVIGIEAGSAETSFSNVPSLLETFKGRPEIAPLIKGGSTVEYAAHVIPEGGLNAMSELYGNGILVAGDAAGFALNIGFTVRGMEYAMASGYFAARAVLKAKERGDFRAETLSLYKRLLEGSFVLQDFKTFQKAPSVVNNPRFFTHYPELVGNLMRDIYAIPDVAKERLFATMKKHLTLNELWSIFKDLRSLSKL